MALVELDSLYVRAIRYLHSVAPDSQYYLGVLLDEIIKTTYGPNPELSAILNVHPPVEFPVVTTASGSVYDVIPSEVKDESRTCSSSDNELELDLLKEDLMCVVCKGMDVAAKNQLLECCECHSLYHQECHDPPIFQEEIDASPSWNCGSCKIQSGKLAIAERVVNPKISAPSSPAANLYPDREVSERNPLKNINSKSVGQSVSTTKQSLVGTNSSLNRVVTPNISIISADKRLQIMKKKAAKMQEKRKLINKQ